MLLLFLVLLFFTIISNSYYWYFLGSEVDILSGSRGTTKPVI